MPAFVSCAQLYGSTNDLSDEAKDALDRARQRFDTRWLERTAARRKEMWHSMDSHLRKLPQRARMYGDETAVDGTSQLRTSGVSGDIHEQNGWVSSSAYEI